MRLTEPQQALADTMSEISQFCWFAGWLSGTEYRLWSFVIDPNDDRIWGSYPIPPEYRERLKQLSDAAGGWVYWREGQGVSREDIGEAFIPSADWEPIYEAWRQSRSEMPSFPRRYSDYLSYHVSTQPDGDAEK